LTVRHRLTRDKHKKGGRGSHLREGKESDVSQEEEKEDCRQEEKGDLIFNNDHPVVSSVNLAPAGAEGERVYAQKGETH